MYKNKYQCLSYKDDLFNALIDSKLLSSLSWIKKKSISTITNSIYYTLSNKNKISNVDKYLSLIEDLYWKYKVTYPKMICTMTDFPLHHYFEEIATTSDRACLTINLSIYGPNPFYILKKEVNIYFETIKNESTIEFIKDKFDLNLTI